jgi:two-component system response regulator TctD
MRILVVEDTRDVGEAIVERFRRLGHAVDWETDGAAAAETLEFTDYDLVILDVMLPGKTGFEILDGLRKRRSAVPVLLLTARSEVEDRVGGLDRGADDYLVKPFDFRELEARARALLRRGERAPASLLECGDIAIDSAARSVRVGNREIHLKRRELALLEILAARAGRVVGKDELLDRLYGYDETPNRNVVELYVARLRKKLHGAMTQIVTVHGQGYKLTPHDTP